MSFFVTLPSNSSMNSFPNNKQTNYTTLLSQPISLIGKYEVAMIAVTYSSQFRAFIGTLKIENPFFENDDCFNRDENITIQLNPMNGTKSHVFFEQLNYQIENVIIYKEYALRYSYATDASKYFTVITDFDDTKRQVSKNTIPVFKFNNKYTVFKYHLESSIDPEKVLNVFKNCGGRLTDGGEWEFTSINLLTEKFKTKTLTCPNSEQTPHGYRIFNLQPREGVFYNDTDKEIRALVKQKNNIHQIPHFSIFGPSLLVNYKNQKPLVFDGLISIMMGKESNYFELFDDMTCDFTEHLSVINHAAIYCDIIESQLFGDVSAPVLQVINLHSSTTADTVTFFDNPAYLNVNKTLINSINIRVVDLQGDPIRFDNIFSFIIIKLHFRKKI